MKAMMEPSVRPGPQRAGGRWKPVVRLARSTPECPIEPLHAGGEVGRIGGTVIPRVIDPPRSLTRVCGKLRVAPRGLSSLTYPAVGV